MIPGGVWGGGGCVGGASAWGVACACAQRRPAGVYAKAPRRPPPPARTSAVGGAPEHVALAHVEAVLVGGARKHHPPADGVQHALAGTTEGVLQRGWVSPWCRRSSCLRPRASPAPKSMRQPPTAAYLGLARGPAGVQHEEGVLCIQPLRRAELGAAAHPGAFAAGGGGWGWRVVRQQHTLAFCAKQGGGGGSDPRARARVAHSSCHHASRCGTQGVSSRGSALFSNTSTRRTPR